MAYTPPSISSIDFILKSYTSPDYNAIAFNMDSTEGYSTVLSTNIQLYSILAYNAVITIEQDYSLCEVLTYNTIQPYNHSLELLAVVDEDYGLLLNAEFIELYDDAALPYASFVQWYYDTSILTSTNIHRYNDVERILRRIVEKYGDATLITNSVIEKYGDAPILTNLCKALYNINHQAFTSFVQRYAITSNTPVNQIIQLYNLTQLNPATATINQLYALLGDSGYASSGLILSYNKNTNSHQVEDISNSADYLALLDNQDLGVSNVLVLVNDTEFVDFIDIEITSTKTSFFIECSIEVPDRATWLKFQEGDTVKVINVLNEFTFMVRSKTRSFSSVATSKYTIELESPTVKLIGPYAKTFSEDYDLGTARSIVETLASNESINVEWELFDWTIPGNTLYASDEFPIEVIKRVVNSAGGITQSTPEGNLKTIKQYPVSPPYWEDAIPEAHISSEEDVFSITESIVENDGYNHYYVTDQESTSNAPSLVTEEITSYSKIAKLFLVPFSDYDGKTITLETTSDDIDIYPPIGSALIVFTEIIVDELVEFKDGIGTLSNPCYGGLIVDPEDLSLGDIEYTEDGTLTAEILDGYSEGYTLAKITYNTKYYKWTVTNNASEDVQLFARIV